MRPYILITILSYSILPATLVATYKIRQCSKVYLPFIIYLLAATINEVISTFSIYYHYSNSINSNIYVLVEPMLLLWLFYNWQTRDPQRPLYFTLAAVILLVWALDTFIIQQPGQFNTIYRATYAFIIAMLAINQLCYQVIFYNGSLRNTRFILAVAFIVKFTYKVFHEMFLALNYNLSNEFFMKFFMIWIYINAITNLIYILAALWIPRKGKHYITSW